MEFLGTRRKIDDKDEKDGARKRKGLPSHLQEVRDDQGRQRLHGAFQGGFSAGYYNTVGSKEGFPNEAYSFIESTGWQPKQFKSGRSGQKDRIESTNAFDFMDADDIQEFGSGVLKEQYDSLGTTESDLKRKRAINDVGEKGIFGSKLIDDLVVAVPTDIGTRLYNLMKRPSRKAEDAEANLLKLLEMKAKQTAMSTYGRGFDPLLNAPEFRKAALTENDTTAEEEEEKTKKPQKKNRGFGTGIFEEDDDEDYDIGSISKSDFDSYIGQDEYEEDVFKKRQKAKNRDSGNTKKEAGRIVVQSAFQGRGRKGGVLAGFISRPLNYQSAPSKLHIAPIPPAGWEPLPSFLHPSFLEKKALQKVEDAKAATEKSKSGNQSIFSYLNMKNKERLESFLNQIPSKNGGPGITSVPPPSKGPSVPPPIFSVPTQVAEAALKGFMPFGNDLPKQARYQRFLEAIIENSKREDGKSNPLSMSDEDALESREFSKAAMIYRPLSNMIASRFTSESGQVATPDKEELPPVKVVRTIGKWKPSKLMCKRFGVAYQDNSDDDEKDKTVLAESKQALNPETMKSLIEERDKLLMKGEISANLEDITPTEQLTKNDMMEVFMDEKEEVLMEADDGINEEKPSMDLFKAIFADSDDDSDDEAETKKDSIPLVSPEVIPHVAVTKKSAPITDLRPPPPLPVPVIKESAKREVPDEDASAASFFRAKSKINTAQKPLLVEESDQSSSFKPVYSGGSSKPKSAVVGSRKKKTAIRVVSYDDDDEEEEKDGAGNSGKIRPSASDFM